MKTLALILALLPCLALADTAAPASLGTFGDWTAAFYGAKNKRACYAFAIAQSSAPSIANRGQVMLTVTERKAARDEVTISAGYTYPAKPVVNLVIDSTTIPFYTAGQNAFTTQGPAAIAAFQQGDLATAKSSGPGGALVTDNFSLAGFASAYQAINASCP